MHAFINAALKTNRTVLLILLLIFIAGINSYIAIPKESSPDIKVPVIYISMTHEGISPEDAERLLVRPMEQELRSIEGLDEMKSYAFLGGSNVVLEFDAGFDADNALADVREAVDLAKPDLPEETDEPIVKEVSLSDFPVIVVTLSGQVDERTLVNIAEDLQDNIEGIPDVLEARIVGNREEVVELVVDPVLMEGYKLDVAQVLSFVQRSNRLVAAGALDTGAGRFAIKVPGLLETAQDIQELPLLANGEGAVVFDDIAKIRPTFRDATGFAWLNGEKAIALEITKRAGRNIINTIEAVKKVVDQEQPYWSDKIEVTYTQDQSIQIRDMLRDLQNNVISAVFLVMIVIIATLGVKSGLLVGMSIPGSFLIGILTLSALGLTVNVVVLFSLILAVGMLVDGSIVITEYADRKLAEGDTALKAYATASKRMAWPIITSTVTTLAAFFPLLFWPDIVGEFMKYMPITLLATLSGSLLMALIFVPTMGSLLYRKKGEKANYEALNQENVGEEELALSLEEFKGFTEKYVGFLRRALKVPGRLIFGTIVFLILIQVMYATFGRGVEFFPTTEPEYVYVNVHARGNLSVKEMDSLTRQVGSKIVNVQGIKSFYAATGQQASGNQGAAEDLIGKISIELADWQERRKATEIIEEVRTKAETVGGVKIEIAEEEQGPQQGKDIQIEVSARDPLLIIATIKKLRELADRNPALINVQDSRPVPGIEWEVNVNREQAAKFGLDISTIGQSVRLVTNGLVLDTYRPEGAQDEIDILVRYPEEFRNLHEMDKIRITSPNGNVPISNFVERVAKNKVGRIERIDSRRVLRVEADAAPGLLASDILKELRANIDQIDLPEGVDIKFRGQNEDQEKSQAFLGSAFGIAIFVIAIILVTQFNSIFHAFLILATIIMSTLGVFVGLLITNQPFGIVMGGVGVIALAGIVVNNNIILIDTYARLRKTLRDPLQAILLTGAQRLRPVFLTTLTTILGLMPMVLGMNIDFVAREITFGAPSTQWWVQLATAIVSGISFATVLTLVITPCALMLKANIDARLARTRTSQIEM